MNILKILLVCVLFTVSFQSYAQVTEKNYKIYSVQTGKEVKLSDIAEDMKDYDVLFYGEEHNDSVTHFLESKMLEELYLKYNSSVTLSMEMFERDVQVVMNEYLKDLVREKVMPNKYLSAYFARWHCKEKNGWNFVGPIGVGPTADMNMLITDDLTGMAASLIGN